MTKINKPLFAVLVIYILCFIFRFIEYFIIRTDQTFWGEAFLHKLLGIVVLFIAAKLYNFKVQDIGFNKNRAVKCNTIIWHFLTLFFLFNIISDYFPCNIPLLL